MLSSTHPNVQLQHEKRQKLDDLKKSMTLSDGEIHQIMTVFENQMSLANSPDPSARKNSDHLMMNTFIRELMDGSEQGDYLGLDLGSTNFRVLLVRFKDGIADTAVKKYTLTDEVLCGPSAGVFDFIAGSIKDFLEEQGLLSSPQKLPLGFVFSFPSEQLALNSQRLLTWTQTFRCPDGPGLDPVTLLEDAIGRRPKALPVDVVVVMSDTTSILLAGNYLDKKCRIGLIIGTGSNAAFVENIDNIAKWTGDKKDPKHVIVNVECGSTGDNGCLDFCRTKYEKEVDETSNHPGSFTFEKSYSGHFLGELTRVVLADAEKTGLLEKSGICELAWRFNSSHVTRIESGGESETRDVLSELGLDKYSSEDIQVIREITECVSKRGAEMVAAAMSTIVNRIGLPEVTIAVDGSLYEKHPRFHDCMTAVFGKFCKNTKVTMTLAKDGSGQGGAFAAVSALRQRERGIRCN